MSNICEILNEKEIHQKLIELKEKTIKTGKEHAFTVCSGGRVSKIKSGKKHKLRIIELYEECNYKIDLDIHSHPKDAIPYPSTQDFFINLYYQPKIASCVYNGYNNTIICFQTSNKIREEYIPKLKKLEDEYTNIFTEYKKTGDTNKMHKLILSMKRIKNKYSQLKNEIYIIFINDILNLKIEKTSRNIKKQYKVLVYDKYKYKFSNYKFGNFNSIKIEYCGKLE